MPSGALMPHQRTRSSPHDPNDPRNAPEGFITVYWAVRSFPTSNGGRGVKDARRREVPGHRTQIPPGAITDTLEVTPQGFTDRHRGLPAKEIAPRVRRLHPPRRSLHGKIGEHEWLARGRWWLRGERRGFGFDVKGRPRGGWSWGRELRASSVATARREEGGNPDGGSHPQATSEGAQCRGAD